MELESMPGADVNNSNEVPKRCTKPKNNHTTKMAGNATNQSKRTLLPTSRPARFNMTSKQTPHDAPIPDSNGNREGQNSFADLSLFGPSVAKRVRELLNKIDIQTQASNDLKRWFAEEDELLGLLREQGLAYGNISDVSRRLKLTVYACPVLTLPCLYRTSLFVIAAIAVRAAPLD
jgi:hypothetical protein